MQANAADVLGGKTALMKAPLLLVLAGLSISTADAADPTETLTLACQGTITNIGKEGGKPEPISMGIIINFTTQTVHGFFDEFQINLVRTTETTIMFEGASKSGVGILGNIDRVTGGVGATTTRSKTDMTSYELQCRQAQRVF